MSHVQLRKICFLLLLGGVSHICLIALTGLQFYSSTLPPYSSFAWLFYSLSAGGVLKSPTIVLEVSISPFNSFSVCWIYFGALMFCAYTCITITSSWWTDLFVLCLVTQSCPTLCEPMGYSPLGSSVHGDSPGKNIGVGCHALLQGIFPTQESNPGLSHCRQILYYLSHQGSPKILEWVAYPFPRGSSWPRNQTRVPCIAGGFFTNWAIREAHRKVHQ